MGRRELKCPLQSPGLSGACSGSIRALGRRLDPSAIPNKQGRRRTASWIRLSASSLAAIRSVRENQAPSVGRSRLFLSNEQFWQVQAYPLERRVLSRAEGPVDCRVNPSGIVDVVVVARSHLSNYLVMRRGFSECALSASSLVAPNPLRSGHSGRVNGLAELSVGALGDARKGGQTV